MPGGKHRGEPPGHQHRRHEQHDEQCRQREVCILDHGSLGATVGEHELEQGAAIDQRRQAQRTQRAAQVEGAEGDQRTGVVTQAAVQGLNTDRLATFDIARRLHQADRQAGDSQRGEQHTNHRHDVEEKHREPVSDNQHAEHDRVAPKDGEATENPLPARGWRKRLRPHDQLPMKMSRYDA